MDIYNRQPRDGDLFRRGGNLALQKVKKIRKDGKDGPSRKKKGTWGSVCQFKRGGKKAT